MEETLDMNSLAQRLGQTLALIETMLRDDRAEAEAKRAHYFDALRRKAAGEHNDNVTSQFFSDAILTAG
ncbi:hypothetical protein [Aureimonas sp. ME7]|uniref:hypothetical protein n=1 Tax=Aureimonas sp. ME7 TaxID=2744252 RepID=UPI0015F6BC93|nr:hypothetical protein [Aureimonas sp. ME7]